MEEEGHSEKLSDQSEVLLHCQNVKQEREEHLVVTFVNALWWLAT